MGDAGAPDTKQESYSSTFILHSSAVSRERVSNPILPSPAPTTPISRRRRTRRSARRGWAGPRLRSGGRRATDARELLIVAILQSSAVSRGGHDLQADFYEARRPLLRSMRNCSKTAPGDTSRRYPHLRRFQGCAREKVGSGRRDLVKRSVTFLGFRVSGNPSKKFPEAN
jgi:hypothetical protein